MKKEILKAILWGFCGAFFMVIGTIIYNSLSKPDFELEYKTLQVKKLTKAELMKLNYENFGSKKIDFSMDDNIIPNYYFAVLGFNNVGSFIEDSLVIDLNFNGTQFKILDVMCKMLEPEERIIDAEMQRPPLKFNRSIFDAEFDEVSLKFEIDELRIGAIVYRSYIKDVGFGRINALPITENKFSIKAPSKLKSCFTLTHMGYSGEESAFGVKVPFPETIFNGYSFKNAMTLDIEKNDLIKKLEDYRNKLEDKKIIFVNLTKEQFFRFVYPHSFTDLPIYFNDDVKFLKGKTSLLFNNIPKKAKYKIYIYYKTYVERKDHNITLFLRDIKNIELKKKDDKIIHEPSVDDSIKKLSINSKEALTPECVKIFLEEDNILISWSIPQNKLYNGVRVFKSILNESDLTKSSLKWGKEIYDGKGFNGPILGQEGNFIFHPKKQETSDIKSKYEPPIKEEYERMKLPTPTGFNIAVEQKYTKLLNSNNGKLMPFFADNSITCNETYLYTLVAYDNNYNYSYPIESIIKHPCNFKYLGNTDTQIIETGVQPKVKSHKTYEKKLLHLNKN